MSDLTPTEQLLTRIAQEMQAIKKDIQGIVNYIHMGEKEVPEQMRRFANYMHDLHAIKYMYEDLGHETPEYLKAEIRRCDDRYRQLFNQLHTDGGAFEKVRREMAKDPDNKYDHTRLLSKG